jgi:sialate O-acetylesterase
MKKHFGIVLFSMFLLYPAFCQVRLPALVRDSMILQRDAPIKIWGWAGAGEKISVRFNNKTIKHTKPLQTKTENG